MPDDWEPAHRLDPNNPDDRNLPGPNDYTMLETYLNQLLGSNPSTTTEVTTQASRPTQFALEQDYPSPFNPTTHIGVRIADFGYVSLKVYDVLGREVGNVVNGCASQRPPRSNGWVIVSGRYVFLFFESRELYLDEENALDQINLGSFISIV